MKRFLSTAAILAIPAFFGLTSCASLFTEYCDKQMSCIGGNDKDRAACASEIRGEEKAAADYGCSDSFDAYYECRNSTAVCTAGKFSTSCDEQRKAYQACIDANSTAR